MNKTVRTWLEIDRQAVKNNYQIWRKLASKSQLMAVVKSNAYGHGLVEFSRLQQKCGVDWFGVDSIVEALALRCAGIIKPLLVLGYTLPENFAVAARKRISLTISTFDSLKKLTALNRQPRIHLKIDSGMHRQGFLPSEISDLVRFLKKYRQLRLEGVYTHLAAAKNPNQPEITLKQIAEFEAVLKIIKQAGFKLVKHAAATGGALIFPPARFDLVRVGIGLYGIWPSKESRATFARRLKLEPVLSWQTIVSEVKRLPRGSSVGYDFTETLARDSVIAICPVGYWHGLPWRLSSLGSILVRGQRAKILGRVCMDMIIIDVTSVRGVKMHALVTLIGRQGSEEITAEELADLAGTSVYELVTRLNPLMKRIYI